jgi:molybdopterin molybdotransferase
MTRGLVLHSVWEAVDLLSRRGPSPRRMEADVDKALGMIAAEEVRAPEDVPQHDRSVLDGYAARWVDISGASPEAPVTLRLAGRISVDSPPVTFSLAPREAVWVDTGAPIPRGADVVVPREYARELQGGLVEVLRAFPAGYGVSVKGEDLREGDPIVEPGLVIDPPRAALLASIGKYRVTVYEPLKAVVYAVGDELVEPWEECPPGRVRVSTARLVRAWFCQHGISAAYGGILPDSEDAIERAVSEALARGVDIIAFTGGTSVGDRDVTVRVLSKMADDYVHGLALTPGRPGFAGVISGTALLGLSGMPVAAWSQLVAVFDEYYRAVLGRGRPWEPVVRLPLAKRYSSAPGMVNVVRSRIVSSVSGQAVEPLRVTGSGILSTLIYADSYFVVPEDVTGYDEGSVIDVRLLYDAGGARCG